MGNHHRHCDGVDTQISTAGDIDGREDVEHEQHGAEHLTKEDLTASEDRRVVRVRAKGAGGGPVAAENRPKEKGSKYAAEHLGECVANGLQ